MAKIFSFNDKRNGSYIDGVSGSVGVPSGGGETGFYQTEKGLAWRGNGVDTHINFAITFPSSTYSFIVWVNKKGNASEYCFDARFGTGVGRFYIDSLNNIVVSSGTAYVDGVQTTDFPSDRDFHCIIVTGVTLSSDTLVTIGRSNASTSRLNGNIGRIQIYDHILTPQERAKLYSEFLNATPITRAIHG